MIGARALFAVGSRLSPRTALLAATIAVATLLGGLGLGKYPFWDDEAGTALFARNIIHLGSRTAWTGTNLVAFNGGADLDDHLTQAEVSPLQFYFAAASFWMLGESTAAGRLPFLLAGLATLWLLHRWTATYLGPSFPSWLPPLLLAVNVPFLLYIAQCRYYALVMMFTAALLWAWAAAERGGRPLLVYVASGLAVLGLFEANYMDAAALAVACTVGYTHPCMRGPRTVICLAVVWSCLVAGVVELLATQGAFQMWDAHRGTMPFVKHFWTLTLWHLEGLGTFEFFPVFLLPVLFLPWLFARLRSHRQLASRALLAVLMIGAVLATVAAISPQDLSITQVADMRYVLPAIVIGSLVTASSIVIVSAMGGRVIATGVTCCLLLTNIAYTGTDRLRCTLCERLNELAEAHPSGTAAMLQAASALSAGTSLAVRPAYMTLPLMFYRPDLRYPGVLDANKEIAPEIRRVLPNWVYCCSDTPDALLVGIGSIQSPADLPMNGHPFKQEQLIKLAWLDQTRPELPWHAFHPDLLQDQISGIGIFYRLKEK